jgi:hypothetical protein
MFRRLRDGIFKFLSLFKWRKNEFCKKHIQVVLNDGCSIQLNSRLDVTEDIVERINADGFDSKAFLRESFMIHLIQEFTRLEIDIACVKKIEILEEGENET